MLATHTESNGDGPLSFGKHFFPNLAHTSSYFGALKQMMDCVEANKDVSDPKT